MSVASHCDAETGVAYCLGGFEDGSVLAWDIRNTGEELARLKLFSEPGRSMTMWYRILDVVILLFFFFFFF